MTELPLLGGTTIWPQLTQRSHRCLLQVVTKTLRSERVKQVRVYSQDVRFCRANAEPTEQYSGTPWQVCVHLSKEGVNVAAAAHRGVASCTTTSLGTWSFRDVPNLKPS